MKNRLPVWFRQELADQTTLETLRLLSRSRVNTVCQEAKCPNLSYCFKQREITFMILGDTCSRNCRFCAVKKSNGKSLDLDQDEPRRIAKIIEKLGLSYVVITSVTRDDLEDGGAGIFAKTLELIRNRNKNIKIEVLIPDFKGNISNLKQVIDASPDVLAHNIEIVKRLYADLRPEACYEISLEVLSRTKELSPNLITKSSVMLGLGEIEKEVIKTMIDLSRAGVDILTLGQYLAPSGEHYSIKEFISLEQFKEYADLGRNLGFKSVFSGPKVRSSYQAEEVYQHIRIP